MGVAPSTAAITITLLRFLLTLFFFFFPPRRAISAGIHALLRVGQTVWSGSCDKTIRVWDANTLDLVSEIGHHEGWVSCLAYGAGLVWSASTDGFVRTFFNLLILILVCGGFARVRWLVSLSAGQPVCDCRRRCGE